MKDNELYVFEGNGKGLDTLKKVLRNQKKNDIWRRCYTREIKVHPLYNNPIGLGLLREEFNIVGDDDFVISCMEKDNAIMLEFPLEKMICVPVRDTALQSLYGRGHVNGTVLNKMNNSDLSTVMNICLQQWGDSSLVLLRDGKVSAVHSGDANDYSVLVMYDLLKALEDGLMDLCCESKSECHFAGGFLNHSICSASFILKDDALVRSYMPYLKKMGYERLDGFYPVVRFSSSDVGICGANISPALVNGKTTIPIGETLPLEHKNKANIEMFASNVKGVYALFQASLNNLERLDEIILEYPEQAYVNLCKKVKVRNVPEAFIDFQNTRGSEVTALELYFAMCEIIRYLENKGEPENRIFQEQEKLARVLTLNIKSFDKPEGK